MRSLTGQCIEEVRASIMGIEGAASTLYWQGVSIVTGGSVFVKRVQQDPGDPFNASLNYGYGILYSRMSACLQNAGLDPYAGFLHTDRPGKTSLVFDMVEEFRQPAVDRALIALFNRTPQGIVMQEGLLDMRSRKMVAGAVLTALERKAMHGHSDLSLGSVIQSQARALASYLRGETLYKGYRFRW